MIDEDRSTWTLGQLADEVIEACELRTGCRGTIIAALGDAKDQGAAELRAYAVQLAAALLDDALTREIAMQVRAYKPINEANVRELLDDIRQGIAIYLAEHDLSVMVEQLARGSIGPRVEERHPDSQSTGTADGSTPPSRSPSVHETNSNIHDALMEDLDRHREKIYVLGDVLKRIRAWDMMDSAADGRYWRKEIDTALRHIPSESRHQVGRDEADLIRRASDLFERWNSTDIDPDDEEYEPWIADFTASVASWLDDADCLVAGKKSPARVNCGKCDHPMGCETECRIKAASDSQSAIGKKP